MTDTPDTPISAEARERIERLRQRRASAGGAAPAAPSGTTSRTGRAQRRRSVATGTKIAAVGLGGTAVFGIMAGLALADTEADTTPIQAPVQPVSPITVVIHTGPRVEQTPALQPVNASAPAPPTSSGELEASAPVELRAQPVVTTVEVPAARAATSSAPAAETSGSS